MTWDQIGSVMHVSNASGNSAGQTLQDAWGNSLADAGGLFGDTPGLDREDWHHNTKEYDGNTGLVYMYQRWYLPETGTFVSRETRQPIIENPNSFIRYSAFNGNPIGYVDVDGRTALSPEDLDKIKKGMKLGGGIGCAFSAGNQAWSDAFDALAGHAYGLDFGANGEPTSSAEAAARILCACALGGMGGGLGALGGSMGGILGAKSVEAAKRGNKAANEATGGAVGGTIGGIGGALTAECCADAIMNLSKSKSTSLPPDIYVRPF